MKEKVMAHTLPDLPYAIDALGPYMSQETLEFHHGKHHNTYVTNLNNLVKGNEFESMSLEDIVKKTYNVADKAGIFNNASQHWNHGLFWQMMKPGGGGAMPGALEARINDSFGSVQAFKEAFIAKAAGQFGSGWAWLVSTPSGKLECTGTPNGVNPLCFDGQKALLGCDVWEHSYYIDYRNRRPDYVTAFLDNMVDWEFVAQQL
jgi:Fe-Mn family superoxide dismutase